MGISHINLEVDAALVKEEILTDDYRLASSGGVTTEIKHLEPISCHVLFPFVSVIVIALRMLLLRMAVISQVEVITLGRGFLVSLRNWLTSDLAGSDE